MNYYHFFFAESDYMSTHEKDVGSNNLHVDGSQKIIIRSSKTGFFKI